MPSSARPRSRVGRLFQRVLQEPVCAVQIVETHGEIGLGQQVFVMGGTCLSCREEFRADSKPLTEQVQHLKRGRSRAGLDARDVRRGTAGECELTLAETGGFARFLETHPY